MAYEWQEILTCLWPEKNKFKYKFILIGIKFSSNNFYFFFELDIYNF